MNLNLKAPISDRPQRAREDAIRRRKARIVRRKARAAMQAPIATPDPPALASKPSARARALHLFQAFLRFVVPAYAVTFGNADAAQLVLLYFFDTWLALIVVFALQVSAYNPVRKWESPPIYELVSSMIGIVAASIFIASFIMVVVAFPLIWVHTAKPLQEILRNPAFQSLLIWHFIFAATSFTSQAWELMRANDARVDAAAARFFDGQFAYVFLRWFLVYLLVFVPFIQFLGPSIFTILCVILYNGFGFAVALFPHQFEAIRQRFFEQNKINRRKGRPNERGH